MEEYYLPIDWRRAKFFICHPTIAPDIDFPVLVPELSVFLAIDCIGDIIMIRNWLHAASFCYRLLGCYETMTSAFRGIVFVFDRVADLLLFRRQWSPVPSDTLFGSTSD